MKNVHLFFLVMLCSSMSLIAQETKDVTTEHQNSIATYLDSNGTMAQYDYAYGQLLSMLGKQFPEKESNAQGWSYLKANKAQAMSEIKGLIGVIYAKHFEAGEIKEMLQFYQTDTAKQLLNDRSKMTETQKEELNAFFNTATGSKIVEKQPVLTSEISKASEEWSRQLYETALSLVKDE